MLGLRHFFTLIRASSRHSIPPFCLQSPRNLLHHLFNNKNWFYHSSIKQNEPGINPPEEKEPIKHRVGSVASKLMIKFTCKKCRTRNTKTMTKLAYEKGVVIIRCDGCKNNHLIADNLGWFGENLTRMNIEKLMKLNGETVKRINSYGELFEVVKNEDAYLLKNKDKT